MATWKTHTALLLSFLISGLTAGAPASAWAQGAPAPAPLSGVDLTVRPALRLMPGLLQVQQAQASTSLSDGARARRRRWAFIGTLAGGSAAVVGGAILGGLALGQAQSFHDQADRGASREDLVNVQTSARQLAFSADMFFGAAVLLGVVSMVLRFGGSPGPAAAPPDPEPAYQVPDGPP